ncbi:Fe(3+)-hydroxamate ABC transporter permease FhuB [Aquitalea aquatica]|uniref:Fe(3+)-hydroxamate ABC transporter permease FhuB n=1 Tax=Aquitalea aquatica TaxID=3044273 RepID=A0A838Y8A0_9NEIS|nr:Fe(3+)-hydroxamate ABC transporter permease FhuB [Aquitalea magnusonii]MBA4707255.1 Fe(3+)-hydroxamate ABC transporter permease FhuB [Aquitalea magnusonii]
MQAVITLLLPATWRGWRYPLGLCGLLGLLSLHLWLDGGLLPAAQWAQLWQAPVDFSGLQFHYAALPRAAMALLVGAALGLSGSVLQQLTGNRLVSPMTLGLSAGAWLGVVLASICLPGVLALHPAWPALGGAMLALGLVLLLAGPQGLNGLPLVLGGMAVNLLLGAVATALVLLHDQYARNLFVWGAGDLAQIDWQWTLWLLPRLSPALLLLWLAPRPLSLLVLGLAAARGRGVAISTILLLLLAALWLSAVSVAAVGLIGFIGLVAPNLASLLGARQPRAQLAASALLGALCLLGSDCLALAFSQWAGDSLPSGAVTALLGAPALLWLARRNLRPAQQAAAPPSVVAGQRRWGRGGWLLAVSLLMLLTLLSVCLSPMPDGGQLRWVLGWPEALLWSLRWPRSLVALSAGAGLAMAGVLLQRLLRNPLASPDLLGLSAGGSLALLLAASWLGQPLLQGGPLLVLAGTLLVLGLLLWLGRRQGYAPGMMALSGIALAALLDALLQAVLAKGTADSFAVLGWLAGSSYRVSGAQALWLSLAVLVLGMLALAAQRVLALLSTGDGVAQGRGLVLERARLGLLLLVALLTAVVTAVLGPVAFLGLLAPHIAALLGARRPVAQLLLAALLGAALLLLADWLGRVLIYPRQLPLGMLASVLCGAYFIVLLCWQRLSRGGGR